MAFGGILFAIVGVIVILKCVHDGVADGLADSARWLAGFIAIAAFVPGALNGDWGWFLGVLVLIGGFFGIRYMADAARMQAQRALDQQRSTPVNEPRPEPTRDWDWDR